WQALSGVSTRMAGTIASLTCIRRDPGGPRTQPGSSSKRKTRTTCVIRAFIECALETLLSGEGNGGSWLFELYFALAAEFAGQVAEAALEIAADLLFHFW